MKCFHCGDEYDANLFMVCPKCGAPHVPPQQQPNYQPPIIIEQKKKGHGCLITFLVVLGIIFLISFLGWLASPGDTSSNNDTQITQEDSYNKDDKNKSTSKKEEKGLYIFDDSELKYKSSKIVGEDHGDSNYLVINFDYTNTSNKTRSFDMDLYTKAFQNGIELQSPISTYGIHDFDFHNTQKEIKPGITIEIQEAFEISDLDNSVTIEIYDNIFSSKPKYEFNIKPKK